MSSSPSNTSTISSSSSSSNMANGTAVGALARSTTTWRSNSSNIARDNTTATTSSTKEETKQQAFETRNNQQEDILLLNQQEEQQQQQEQGRDHHDKRILQEEYYHNDYNEHREEDEEDSSTTSSSKNRKNKNTTTSIKYKKNSRQLQRHSQSHDEDGNQQKKKKKEGQEQQRQLYEASSLRDHDDRHQQLQRPAARGTASPPLSFYQATRTGKQGEYSAVSEDNYLKEQQEAAEEQSGRGVTCVSSTASGRTSASPSYLDQQQRENSKLRQQGNDHIEKELPPRHHDTETTTKRSIASSSNTAVASASDNEDGSRTNGASRHKKQRIAASPSTNNMNSSLAASRDEASYCNRSFLNTRKGDNHADDKRLLCQESQPPQERDQDDRDNNMNATGPSATRVLPLPSPNKQYEDQKCLQLKEEEYKRKWQQVHQVQRNHKDQELSIPTSTIGAINRSQPGTKEEVTAATVRGTYPVGNPTPLTAKPSAIVKEQGGYYVGNNITYVNNNVVCNNTCRIFPPSHIGQEQNLHQNIYSGSSELDVAQINSLSRNQHYNFQKTTLLNQSVPSILFNAAHQPHHHLHTHQQVGAQGFQFQPYARGPTDAVTCNLPVGNVQLGQLTTNGVNRPLQQASQQSVIHTSAQQHVPTRFVSNGDITPTTFVGSQASNLNMNHQRQQALYSQEYYLGAPPNDTLRVLLDAQLRNLHAEQLLLLSLQQQHQRQQFPQHVMDYSTQGDFARSLSGQNVLNSRGNLIHNNHEEQVQCYGQNQADVVQKMTFSGGDGRNRNTQIGHFSVPPQTYYEAQPNGPTNQHLLSKKSTDFERTISSSHNQSEHVVHAALDANHFGDYNMGAMTRATIMERNLASGNVNHLHTEQLLSSQQQGIGMNSELREIGLMQKRLSPSSGDPQYPRSSVTSYLHQSSPYFSNFDSNAMKILGNTATESNTIVENENALQSSKTKGKNVPKSKKAGKGADAPLNPLHAYNFFFRDERKKILKSIPVSGEEECDSASDNDMANKACVDDEGNDNDYVAEKSYEIPSEEVIEKELKRIGEERRKIKTRVHKKTHGKIGFNELTKVISERWQNASDKVKSYYKTFALADAKRYAAEMKEYRRGFVNSDNT